MRKKICRLPSFFIHTHVRQPHLTHEKDTQNFNGRGAPNCAELFVPSTTVTVVG